jgi:hypothetical protein
MALHYKNYRIDYFFLFDPPPQSILKRHTVWLLDSVTFDDTGVIQHSYIEQIDNSWPSRLVR